VSTRESHRGDIAAAALEPVFYSSLPAIKGSASSQREGGQVRVSNAERRVGGDEGAQTILKGSASCQFRRLHPVSTSNLPPVTVVMKEHRTQSFLKPLSQHDPAAFDDIINARGIRQPVAPTSTAIGPLTSLRDQVENVKSQQ